MGAIEFSSKDGATFTRLDTVMQTLEKTSPEDLIVRDELIDSVRGLLQELPSLDWFVLRHRYGIDGVDELTQKQGSRILGLKHGRVKSIQNRAVERLLSSRRPQLEDLLAQLQELDSVGVFPGKDKEIGRRRKTP